MTRLTTHVLDLVSGRPAAGVAVALYSASQPAPLLTARTNGDGRTDAPLLEGEAMRPGRYRLVFAIGAYHRSAGLDLPQPSFLDDVAIAFGIADPERDYHIPLLVSAFGYSTYRGS